jgi:hypothetical protein
MEEQAGATGNFPKGKLSEDDQGELNMRFAIKDNILIINFGEKPVQWIGLDKQAVKELISRLLEGYTKLK